MFWTLHVLQKTVSQTEYTSTPYKSKIECTYKPTSTTTYTENSIYSSLTHLENDTTYKTKKYGVTQCRYNSAEDTLLLLVVQEVKQNVTSIIYFSNNGVTCSSIYYSESYCEYRKSSQAFCTGASASYYTQVSNLNIVIECEAKTYD